MLRSTALLPLVLFVFIVLVAAVAISLSLERHRPVRMITFTTGPSTFTPALGDTP